MVIYKIFKDAGGPRNRGLPVGGITLCLYRYVVRVTGNLNNVLRIFPDDFGDIHQYGTRAVQYISLSGRRHRVKQAALL